MKRNNTIRNFFLENKPLEFMWKRLHWLRTRFYLRYNPKFIANSSYRSVFQKDINWDKPVDLTEKIQWLQIYSDTSLWTICADKYLARHFIKEKGCEEVLNELYGKWNNVNDIDWSKLPNSFVLKANHSSGQVILVKDKNELDINHTTIQLNSWMKTMYGYANAQLHYTRIKPCIIAEKLLINKNDPDKPLIDYKITCFQGVPENIIVVFDRTENSLSVSLYDMKWNNISDKAIAKENKYYSEVGIAKPSSFDKMIEVATKVSKDFPHVRVDFYDIDDEAVFGEMTFTPAFGYYSEEYHKYLGSKIDLSKVEKLLKPNCV